jgi:hypothetical protein
MGIVVMHEPTAGKRLASPVRIEIELPQKSTEVNIKAGRSTKIK